MCRVAKLPFKQARVKSITEVVGRMYAIICSQKGKSSTGNQAPQRNIVEKKNAKKTLKLPMSKIRAVRPKAALPSKMQPKIRGRIARGDRMEVAEPKIITRGKMKRQSITPLLTAQRISPQARDSALIGVAKIASYVDW
jgi:hypothetical protein